MLELAQEVTGSGAYTYLEYARFADNLVILADAYAAPRPAAQGG
jgi:RNA-directed DNA polymerase